MLFYVVLKPDKKPLETPFLDQKSAQEEIEKLEPDLAKRSQYQIHPITQLSQLKNLGVKHRETVTLEKFDGEYVPGKKPVEVITLRS